MTVLDRPSITDNLEFVNHNLDLSNVRMKLANPETGTPPSDHKTDLMEAEYRKFLALHLRYPDADIVPCKLVDDMWHRHILDTAAYRQDCDKLFGEFLDHFPYFGLRGDKDAQALTDAYADTLRRYRDNFGEPPHDTWIAADASGRCKRTACKPQKCR